MIYVFFLLVLTSCMFHPTSLDDVAESVQSKGRGVTIDIEPGNRK